MRVWYIHIQNSLSIHLCIQECVPNPHARSSSAISFVTTSTRPVILRMSFLILISLFIRVYKPYLQPKHLNPINRRSSQRPPQPIYDSFGGSVSGKACGAFVSGDGSMRGIIFRSLPSTTTHWLVNFPSASCLI